MPTPIPTLQPQTDHPGHGVHTRRPHLWTVEHDTRLCVDGRLVLDRATVTDEVWHLTVAGALLADPVKGGGAALTALEAATAGRDVTGAGVYRARAILRRVVGAVTALDAARAVAR